MNLIGPFFYWLSLIWSFSSLFKADSHQWVCIWASNVCKKEKGSSECKVGERVIKDLMRKLKCKSDHFFCDNFFPSFSIFRDMLADGLYAHGTVWTHCEGLPNNLKQG